MLTGEPRNSPTLLSRAPPGSRRLLAVPETRNGEHSTTKVGRPPPPLLSESWEVPCGGKAVERFWVSVPTVERRRRDKINNWIVQLSKTIPDCNIDYTKTGQVSPGFIHSSHPPAPPPRPPNPNVLLSQSKGGILSKACEYIKELRQSNLKLGEDINSLDRLRIDNQLLRQEVGRPGVVVAAGGARACLIDVKRPSPSQVEDWKSKNQILRNLLRQHGIVGSSGSDPQ